MAELVKGLVSYGNELLAVVIAVFCFLRWQFVAADRKRTELLMVVSVLSFPLGRAIHLITLTLINVRSVRYDLYIYRMDALFGEPSFVLGRTLIGHPKILDVLALSYTVLPIVMVGVFATYLWLRPQREAWMVLYTFILNLVCAVPLYLALPVCGPYYAFARFPDLPPGLSPHPISLAEIPNGIPSVHMSTALLALWFLRRWPVGRVLGTIYLGLTVYATLGSGQHYLIDLLCAFPYATAVYWVAKRVRFPMALSESSERAGLECGEEETLSVEEEAV